MPIDKVDFDEYADRYDAALAAALATTGENKEYFAAERVRRLRRALSKLGTLQIASVLDFGCGTGSAVPFLRDQFPNASISGVDVSERSLQLARQQYPGVRFHSLKGQQLPQATFGLIYTNGVFHHIPRAERGQWLALIKDRLAPGGWFSMFENNPWNPGTRYVMSNCEFDRDAVCLSPAEARRILRDAGFEVVRSEFYFFFPSQLRLFRPLETALVRLPLGGQFCCLARARR